MGVFQEVIEKPDEAFIAECVAFSNKQVAKFIEYSR